jgi:hypothetical protein
MKFENFIGFMTCYVVAMALTFGMLIWNGVEATWFMLGASAVAALVTIALKE